MTKEEIGEKLRAERLFCRMKQQEVAEKIGRKQPIVGHWETGYSQPDANTLFTLCDIYGTTVDDLFGFTKKESFSSSEREHIEKYRALDSHGKEMVDFTLLKEWERSIADQEAKNKVIQMAIKEDVNYVNAAHTIEDASEEDKQFDEDIMHSDTF